MSTKSERTEIAVLQTQMTEVKADVSEVKSDVKEIKAIVQGDYFVTHAQFNEYKKS